MEEPGLVRDMPGLLLAWRMQVLSAFQSTWGSELQHSLSQPMGTAAAAVPNQTPISGDLAATRSGILREETRYDSGGLGINKYFTAFQKGLQLRVFLTSTQILSLFSDLHMF